MKSGTRLSYKDVVCVATQILEIMLFLESVHVIHGNLDLKQFYYSDGKVMLSDLWIHTTFQKTSTCQLAYSDPDYTPESPQDSEVWRFGVMLYTLLTGRLPFFNKNQTTYLENVKGYKFDVVPNVPVFDHIFCPRASRLRLEQITKTDLFSGNAFQLPPQQKRLNFKYFSLVYQQFGCRIDDVLGHGKLASCYHLLLHSRGSDWNPEEQQKFARALGYSVDSEGHYEPLNTE